MPSKRTYVLFFALVQYWCGAFTVSNLGINNQFFLSRNINENCRGVFKDRLTNVDSKIFLGKTLDASESDSLQTISSNQANVNNFPGSFIQKVILSIFTIGLVTLCAHNPAFASSIATVLPGGSPSFYNGFVQAFLLIFVSEIGDKTFFIAALLAAKYNRFISFVGSIAALAIMTGLSTILGQIFHAVPTSLSQGIPFDDYIAIAAFTYFGFKTLKDAYDTIDGSSGIEEEKAEAEKSVEELVGDQKRRSTIALILQTFSLVFAAEIGDKSFLSTIALSAAQNPFSVAAGALAGHAVATGMSILHKRFYFLCKCHALLPSPLYSNSVLICICPFI